MTLSEELARIEKLCNEAAKGPIKFQLETEKDKKTGEERETGRGTISQDWPGGILIAYTTKRDGNFYLSSRTLVPRLVMALREQMKKVCNCYPETEWGEGPYTCRFCRETLGILQGDEK